MLALIMKTPMRVRCGLGNEALGTTELLKIDVFETNQMVVCEQRKRAEGANGRRKSESRRIYAKRIS